MTGTVFRWQLADNLRSLRFLVSLGVLLVFFIASGVIFAHKLERDALETVRLQAADADTYDVASVADGVDNWYRIELAPLGTEFLADAGYAWTYTGMWVNPRSGETLWLTSTRTTNNWMARFEVVDWTVVARYVVTFLCVVLAYNAISGERERGTLRLLLANPVPRAHLLLGKFLAHWVTVLAAAAVAAAVNLLILVITGVLGLDGHVAGGVAVWLAGVACLSALFLLLGIGISALSPSSATSLVFLVTAWTVIVVVVPQTSYLVATRAVEPLGPYWEAMSEHRTQTQRALRLEGVRPRGRDAGAVDGYTLEKEYARRLGQLETDLDAMRRDLNARIFRQYEVARAVNMVSPGYAFQYAVEGLLGAGIAHLRAFFADAWRYRDDLRGALRDADARDPASPGVAFLADYMSEAPLDGTQLPRFRSRRMPLEQAVAAALVPGLILILETAAAFAFALWAVNRAEVTAP